MDGYGPCTGDCMDAWEGIEMMSAHARPGQTRPGSRLLVEWSECATIAIASSSHRLEPPELTEFSELTSGHTRENQ